MVVSMIGCLFIFVIKLNQMYACIHSIIIRSFGTRISQIISFMILYPYLHSRSLNPPAKRYFFGFFYDLRKEEQPLADHWREFLSGTGLMYVCIRWENCMWLISLQVLGFIDRHQYMDFFFFIKNWQCERVRIH